MFCWSCWFCLFNKFGSVSSVCFNSFIWFVSSVGPIITVDFAGQAKTNNNRTKTIIMTFDKGNDAWPIFFPQGSVCLVESVGSVVVLLEIFVSVGSVCSDDSVGTVVVSQEIIPGPEQPRENVLKE